MTLLKHSTIDSFFNDFDSFFNSMFPDFSRSDANRIVEGYPITNIYTNKDGDLKFEIAVTGFPEKDLNVSIEDGCLVVTGDTDDYDKYEDEWKFISGKLKHSKFEKRYRLSHRLNSEETKVGLKNGVLTVIIPAKEESKPKTLQIDINS